MQKTKKILILFIVIICTPILLKVTNTEPNLSSAENRAHVPTPTFSLKRSSQETETSKYLLGLFGDYLEYKSDIDKYCDDNFLFKNTLFNIFKFIESDLFSVNPLPHKLIQAKNGWLFLGDKHSNVLKESKGILQFSEYELSVMKENLMKKHDWLKSKNINYIVAVAPSKHTIYGNEINITQSSKKTKLEQLDELFETEELNFINLKKLVKENSQKQRLYYKTDSHWNDLGAYWGYKTLINEIQQLYPNIPEIELENLKSDTAHKMQKDLSRMLDKQIREDYIDLSVVNIKASRIKSQLPIPSIGASELYECRYLSDVNKLKVLIFRDSFCISLAPYLKESFGESVFIWSYVFNPDIIESEKPDLVIDFTVERNIDDLIN